MMPTVPPGYFKPPEAEDSSPKKAISALLIDIAVNSSEVIATHGLDPASVPYVEHNFLQTVKSLRCIITMTYHFVKTKDREDMKELRTIVFESPGELKQPEILDRVIDRLIEILKSAGIYELGEPSKMQKIEEDFLAEKK